MKTTSAGRNRIGQRNKDSFPRKPLLKGIATCLRKAFPPLLFGAIPIAEAATTINNTYSTQTLNSDTAYVVNAGTTVETTSGGDTIVINGISPVLFTNNGTISNNQGTRAAVMFNVAGTLDNNGSILGNTRGVYLAGGGSGYIVNNYGDISVISSHAVEFGGGTSGTVNNYNTINGNASTGVAADGIVVSSNNGAQVTVNNASGASIFSGFSNATYGSAILAGSGALVDITNSGTLSGYHYGVNAEATDAVVNIVNNAGGMIQGQADGGIQLQSGSGLTNSGTVQATTSGSGVLISGSNNTVTNLSGGKITSAAGAGITVGGNSNTIVNSGTITGTGQPVINLLGNNNSLTLDNNAVVNGSIVSTGTGNTMLLTKNGTLSSDFSGLSSIIVNATTGSWVLQGSSMGTSGTDMTALNVQSGTLILTGTLTHTAGGGTTIASGATLQVGAGVSGWLNGDIANDGRLVFARSDNTTFSGQITGSGDLGTAMGTLTLANSNNSYSGVTTVSGGTLKLGANNALGNTSNLTIAGGAITDINGMTQTIGALNGAGSLNMNGGVLSISGGGDFSGVISGTGNALNMTGGTLTLTGSNTYTGNTSVASAATLQIGNGGTVGSYAGDLNNSGVVIFNRSDNVSYAGVFSGTGTLRKSGAGTLTLTGTGSQQGTVSVDAGTLALAQAGVFNAVDLTTATGATTSIAANSLLNLSGALTQDSGATLYVDLSSNPSSAIITADTAMLDGELTVNGFSATAPAKASLLTDTDFTIISTTNGIAGDFSSINSSGSAIPDYLTLMGRKSADNKDYNVGYGLTWFAGTEKSSGTFTLTNSSDTFEVDVVLSDQSGSNSWDGDTLSKLGAGTLILSAANTYSGATGVYDGTLRVTGAGSIGSGPAKITGSGVLFFDQLSSGNFTFNHALTGNGTLRVNLTTPDNIFAFGTGVGNSFTGLVELGNSTFTLSGDNTSVLAGATLQLDAGNTTTVGANQQTIGNLALNGGTLRFANLSDGGTIATSGLKLVGGTVAVDSEAIVNSGSSLLAQDEGVDYTLITANSVSGSASFLSVTDLSGSPVSTVNIEQGGNTVAVGTYGFSLGNDATSLYTRYVLTQLALQSGMTTTLSGDTATPSGANELHAKLTGAGNLAIDATTSITLNNNTNDYTGSTTVNAGTLILGSDSALGNTSNLVINSGTTVDINGKTQTIGALNGAGGLNMNAGNLDITNGGVFSGMISGSAGSLGLTGGILTLTGNNTYTGTTTVDSGATLQIGNSSVSGGYAGDIVDNGSVIFYSGAYDGKISGSGEVIKNGSGTLNLSGISSYSGGTDINAGTVIASNGSALGTGIINNAGSLQLNFAADSTLVNTLSGNGSLIKTGSGTATLTGTGSQQGIVNVNAGTLAFAQNGVFDAITFRAANGATTSISANSKLNLRGEFFQAAGATLEVAAGANEPAIQSNTTYLNGTLNVTGYNNVAPGAASLLSNADFTVISSTQLINGDFSTVNVSGVTSPDYLTIAGRKSADGKNYNIGYGLTWLEGTAKGNGVFTLTNSSDVFNVDVTLADQTGPFASGWDGKTLTKAGAGTLTLSAANTYSGGTVINAGTVIATNANALGTGTVSNSSILQLDFAADGTLTNLLNGNGTLTKTGTGKATLTGGGTQGAVNVNDGTLAFAQSGAFNALSLSTANGASTSLASGSTLALSGALTQNSSATLSVDLTGNTSPSTALITAASANLSGTLNIDGFGAAAPAKSSELTNTQYTIIQTTGGITGDFTDVTFGSVSPVDYLTLVGGLTDSNTKYKVGLGLSWLAGNAKGHGTFTLADGTTFEADTVLADQSGTFTSGWDGQSLTKNGAGTLILSAANTYTGNTNISAGTLQTGVIDAFAHSSNVTIASGATLAMNDYSQTANNLSGSGAVSMGTNAATVLTVNSGVDTTFNGVISGAGSLSKTGANALTLSGNNSYSGGTTISAGKVIATNGNALGSGTVANNAALELAFTGDGTLSNVLSGTGSLTKSGNNTVTLTGTGSQQGAVTVSAGTLAFAQSGAFDAASLTTANGATTSLASGSTLDLSGTLTQNSTATLDVALGTPGSTVITAGSAALGGTLNISNFDVTRPTKASEADSNVYTIISTISGISGDFSSVNLNGATSTVDYLTLFSGKSTDNKNYNIGFGLSWLAGTAKGHGTFTLADGTTFEADTVLADQSGTFTSGWDGQSLTKAGAGTLILSAANTYTGNTNISAGTLQTGVIDAFAHSSNVTIASGATLAMNDYSQTANNLSGSGAVSMGTNAATVLTVNSGVDTTFNGVISGAGSLSKTGANALTLSGNNSYSGGTTISAGKVIATNGNALGSGTVTNNAALELAFTGDGTLSNVLSGTGSLTKSGNNTVSLTGTGSQQGAVNVNVGTLSFEQSGEFKAASLSTASGATTSIAADSTLKLSGALTQNGGSTLTVALGSAQPIINAVTATLAGTLNVSGFSSSAPNKASELTNTQYTIIQTSGGITGDFTSIDFGGAASSVDYLTLFGGLTDSNTKYKVGFGLSWLAGNAKGHGTFTLADGATFEADTVLADQSGTFTSGWDGQSLTKAGAGTLILSAANTYTGNTNISAGTLQTGVIDAFAHSSNVTIASGATLAMNDYSQTANNLSGSGAVSMGTNAATVLTVNSGVDTTFNGVISGAGSLSKTGANALTLSGNNSYSGGTTISAGKLIATNGNALGSGTVTNNAALELAFTGDGTLSNVLSGTGSLTKSGNNTVSLTGAGSQQGAVNVNVGTLSFEQSGEFKAASLSTASGATTNIAADSTLKLSGVLTQNSGSTLTVELGSTQPVIDAVTASLDGSLRISGFGASAPTKASELTNTAFKIIQTTGGISGNFTDVSFGGSSSPVDYLTLSGALTNSNKDYSIGFGLTWTAGTAKGHGTFTLADGTTFEADTVLADQSGTFTSGWDGQSLTKDGAGTLILSAANTYTGNTNISAGTLQTGVIDAFAHSSNVTIASGATLAMNDYSQTANNLSGSGAVSMGTNAATVLTVNSGVDTTFNGVISGAGSLSKTGANALTLSGNNSYSGGTTISAGKLIATNGNALGSGTVTNNAALELAFTGDGTLSNVLSGTGSLTKSGSGVATLGNGGTQGSVDVNAGTLELDNGVTLNTSGNYTTASSASTTLNKNARLDVGGHFDQQGILNVEVDTNLPTQPVIDATTAAIGTNAVFNLEGYHADPTASASELADTRFTVIQTASSGGLSGTFNTIHIGGSSVSDVDYLMVRTFNTGQKFDVGIGLSWYMGASIDPTKAHGTFTLNNASDAFDMDAKLVDQAANAVTGWDGISLTKKGLGTLQLSQQNTYTGDTLIQGGTLRTGIADAIATSAQVIVSGGATLDLNNYDQHVNMLSGAGNVTLGSADLTSDYATDATFSGVISGTGAFTKTGVGTLLLTGDNTYSGATTISSGTLQLGNGGASGSVVGDIVNNGQLIIDRSADYAYNGTISGSGNLVQQGSGSVLFSHSQSYTGTTDINAGALILENGAQLSGTQLVTVAQGATLGGYGGVGGDVVNHGLLAVADAVPGYANSPAGTFTVGGNLVNNGEIRMASPLPASTLVINGNYIGNNGLLTLSTVLGGDNSATDKLIVHGNTSGTTRVVVNNSSGIGAQTTNGIEIIQVDGQSDGQFTLSNRVVAGAYEYGLYQGLPNQMNGNWYLRSESQNGQGEWWRPEIGGYLGNQSLASLMQVHTLFDRQGAQFSQDSGSFWIRVIGGQVDSKAAHGNVDMDSDYTLVQLGADVATYRNGTQQLQIGLMGNWGQGNTDSTGNRNSQGSQSTANSKVDGYALGMYATWFADVNTKQGLYVDSWLQYGWYDNKVTGQGMRTDNYDSTLWTVSLESGYTIALGDENSKVQWRLTPQAQVIYGQYSADRFTDVSGTVVDGQDNNLWTTRLGLRLSGQMRVNNNRLIQPFTEMNWWHNGQNSSVALTSAGATTVVNEDVPKDRAELKMGVQGQFSKNWSGWAHVGWQSDFQDYQRLEGMAGLRYVW